VRIQGENVPFGAPWQLGAKRRRWGRIAPTFPRVPYRARRARRCGLAYRWRAAIARCAVRALGAPGVPCMNSIADFSSPRMYLGLCTP
jgi:hypothetical protein